jgi:hypothetical protein
MPVGQDMPRLMIILSPKSTETIKQINRILNFYSEFWKDIKCQMSFSDLYLKEEYDTMQRPYKLFKHTPERNVSVLTKVNYYKSETRILITNVIVRYRNKEYGINSNDK